MKKRRGQASRNMYPPPSPSPSFGQILLGWLKVGISVIAIIGIAILTYFACSLYFQARDLPDVSSLERYEPIEAIQIFDRNDHLVCMVEGDENRQIIPLNQISPTMQQAILAAEDHHFFEHHGINFASIFRALMVNVQAGHVVEGGSTITQQLVKNLFFNQSGRTFGRKLKEAVLAFELERRYSKEKILELYLNQVYFGSTAYGIERAAARYFNKTAATLNLAESAFLAGLVKAPSELGSPHNRAAAKARQREILSKMVEYGYITASQERAAEKTQLVFHNGANPFSKYPYYISYVLQILREKFSETEMRKQGLKVYTNLDQKVEQIAENTLNEAIKHAPKGVSQGALVSVSVADGAVLALVGGVGDFWKNQFNRAVNPHTVGSSFKPFVYLTAFNSGAATPDSAIDDSPFIVHQGWGLPDYVPKNFDHKFYGRISVRRALALSRNIPALRMAQRVGIDKVIETARLAGIKAKLDPNLSLALGSSAVSPLEMAGAYSTFARGGILIKPKVIRRIENNRNQVIEVFEEEKVKAFPPEPIAELVDVLQDVVKHGTGTQAKLADRPVAGKTGTADAGKDIWFIGFTPDLVTAVWGGNDENLPIPGHNITGGVIMAKIWHDYNEAYYKAFTVPPGSFTPYDRKAAAEKVANFQMKLDTADHPNTGTTNTDQNNQPGVDHLKFSPGIMDPNFLQPKVEEIEKPSDNPIQSIEPLSAPNTVPTAPAPLPAPAMPSPLPAGTAKQSAASTQNTNTTAQGVRLIPQQATLQYVPPAAQPLTQSTPPASNPTNLERIDTKVSEPTTTPKRLYPYSYPYKPKANF